MSEEVVELSADAAEPAADEETSDQLPADHPLVKTLSVQKAEIRELKAKAKRLDELEESTKSEAQRMTERADAEFNRAEAAEAALIRYEVAATVGIPVDAIKFLNGTTRDEIETSARDFVKFIGETGKPRPPKPDPNQGRGTSEVTSPEAQFGAFLQNQLNN